MMIGTVLDGTSSSKEDLMNIVMSQDLFATLSHQKDWDGKIMSVGSTIGTLVYLLWSIRNSVYWLEIMYKN